jgi:DNA-binding response OmpR family regulator
MNASPVIYILDDDDSTRELLSVFCEIEGYQPRSFESGVDLLVAMNDLLPTAVLLDVMMRDLDGFRICRSIRSNPRTRRVPVILMSGLTRPVDLERAREVLADAYLPKPVDVGQLFARLQGYVNTGSSAAAAL